MSEVVDPSETAPPVESPKGPGSVASVKTTAIGVVGAASGFWLTYWYVRGRGAIEDLYREQSASADVDVWLIVLGSIGATAFAVGLLSIVWLVDLERDSDALEPRTISIWSIATGGVLAALIVTAIYVSSEAETGSLNGSVANATRALTIGVAICSLPGLLYFVALRTAAGGDDWLRRGATSVKRLFLLRRRLVRQTSLFGALLTLIVIATGLRRRTLLKIDDARPEAKQEMLEIPIEQVLLYGLVFAALLGLFYFLAGSALTTVSRSLVDEYAPIPHSGEDGIGAKLALRTQVESFISPNGSRQTFEASVLILSPLVTALIGAAIG